MTVEPSAPTEPGTAISITCRTESARPAASIAWQLPNKEEAEQWLEAGEFGGQTRVSVVKVTARLAMDGWVYKCWLEGDESTSQEYQLRVDGKY